MSSFMQFKAYEEPQKHPKMVSRFNAKDFVNLSVTPVLLSVLFSMFSTFIMVCHHCVVQFSI